MSSNNVGFAAGQTVPARGQDSMETDMNPCTTRALRRALVSLAAAIFGLNTAARAADLTVYTALEADQLKPYKAAFEKTNPGINILWVRDSTGIITAKLLAEKANPKADVVMGLAATSLMLLQKEGMLMPYAPAGLDKIDPKMRDPASPPDWVGMDVWASALCVNMWNRTRRTCRCPPPGPI